MTAHPPKDAVSWVDRLFLSGRYDAYHVSGNLVVISGLKAGRDEVLLKSLVPGALLYVDFTGAEAVNLARLLLRLVEDLSDSKDLADLPSHWLAGFQIKRGQPRKRSRLDETLDRLLPFTKREQRRYRLGRGRALIAHPDEKPPQVTLEGLRGETLYVGFNLAEAEGAARIIMSLLGDRPEYQIVDH